jgi:YfiR/HmsC-like
MALLSPFGMRRGLRTGVALLAFLAAGGTPVWGAGTAVSEEYRIKAAFLFNFAQFVKWPPGAFRKADSPFCIGILGKDPFDSFLDETVKGETVDGHPLVVRRYPDLKSVGDCQILFISKSEQARMGALLQGLKGRSILTVGDIGGFAEAGGVIRFVTEDNKIHFRINLEAAKDAKLDISSQVLRLAEIVGRDKE